MKTAMNAVNGKGHVPKLIGADVELCNTILGIQEPGEGGAEASRALLREIDGHPSSSSSGSAFHRPWFSTGQSVFNPQDFGRKYQSSNGGCFYIDLNHLEFCPPEVISAYDHVAAYHAMLRRVRMALEAFDF